MSSRSSNEVLNERIIPFDIASPQSDVKLEKKPSVSTLAEESDVVWSWQALRLSFIFFLISNSMGLTFPREFGRRG